MEQKNIFMDDQKAMKLVNPNNGNLEFLNTRPQFSIVKIGSKYRLITQGDLLSEKIYSY
jgi:hypothetical protein